MVTEIRPATMADFPQFYALCERFRAELKTYPGCDLDRPSVMQTFGRCVASALHFAWVAVRDGTVTGALLAVSQELWWSRARETTDVMFYSEHAGDGLKLMRAYLEWARTVPRVKVITMAHSSGEDIERLARMYARAGLKRIGALHQMVVEAA